jgi:hypothetical protein
MKYYNICTVPATHTQKSYNIVVILSLTDKVAISSGYIEYVLLDVQRMLHSELKGCSCTFCSTSLARQVSPNQTADSLLAFNSCSLTRLGFWGMMNESFLCSSVRRLRVGRWAFGYGSIGHHELVMTYVRYGCRSTHRCPVQL